MVTEDADILDPDGDHARTLDRWEGAWGDVVMARPRPDDGPRPETALTPAYPPPAASPWRASG